MDVHLQQILQSRRLHTLWANLLFEFRLPQQTLQTLIPPSSVAQIHHRVLRSSDVAYKRMSAGSTELSSKEATTLCGSGVTKH